jgi:vitamin K-dependent gamma-carboxylase-like protein
MRYVDRVLERVFAPQPIARLEAVRIGAPLAILGFLASRILHADDWLSTSGFHVPAHANDWRQPLELPAVPSWAAWAIAIAIVISGLAVAAGALTRWSTAVFAALLAYVALADRLEAFTVSKLGTSVAVALALTPCGTRFSVDAWRKGGELVEQCSGGSVRFFQILVPVFYCASGLCKATHDWLTHRYVMWTYLHDSYQTSVSWFFANHLPPAAWTVMQATTLAFELGAPVWFGLRWTRPYALAYGIAMHVLIGAMFGPVKWFALLMIVLLVAAYAPIPTAHTWRRSRTRPDPDHPAAPPRDPSAAPGEP